jgi:hypothetical protein
MVRETLRTADNRCLRYAQIGDVWRIARSDGARGFLEFPRSVAGPVAMTVSWSFPEASPVREYPLRSA